MEGAISTAFAGDGESSGARSIGAAVGTQLGAGLGSFDFTTSATLAQSNLTAAMGAVMTASTLSDYGMTTMGGLANTLSGYSFSGTGSAIGSNVRTAVSGNLNTSTLRSAGVNAMSGLKAGINAGRSGVISAMRSAARAAVNAAKSELKIKSPSRVFEDEVGVMTMRGLGQGILKESKAQAKIIRNASRYLTDEAHEGSIVSTNSDNRKSFDNSVTSTIQVQQMVVRDEQDIRSLAVEIATLTRRQQRGKGLRMA